jgi:hypothetical protein
MRLKKTLLRKKRNRSRKSKFTTTELSPQSQLPQKSLKLTTLKRLMMRQSTRLKKRSSHMTMLMVMRTTQSKVQKSLQVKQLARLKEMKMLTQLLEERKEEDAVIEEEVVEEEVEEAAIEEEIMKAEVEAETVKMVAIEAEDTEIKDQELLDHQKMMKIVNSKSLVRSKISEEEEVEATKTE